MRYHNIFSFKGKQPKIHPDSFVAFGARIIGDIELAEGVSVWYNSVLRADVHAIRIGRFSNIQDNSTLHVESPRAGQNDSGSPTILGDYVTVGHGCILHACTVEDYCLIGMGAIILDGAVIGKGSIVGAGTLVTKGSQIPPFSVVLGSPGKVVKNLPEESLQERKEHAEHYWKLAQEHKDTV